MRQDMLIAIMADAIGREKAQRAVEALMDSLGGSRIDIPKGDAERRASRDKQIRRLYRQGIGYAVLAERFALSEKSIRRIVGT